jgi:hypothetical protein
MCPEKTIRAYLRKLRSAAVVLLVTAVAGGAYAQNARNELPIPASPEADLTAIQRTFKPPPPPPLTLFPELRDRLQDLPPFLRDSKFSLDPRSYYRDVVTNAPDKVTVKEAWAAGGSVSFETGRLFDVISGGLVFYTSLPLYGPIQYDGTQLLLPGQLGYDVVGQIYGKVHLGENLTFTAGRYLYDTPYLGPFDTRMTPNTFYGYTLIGTLGDDAKGGPSFRYGAGYIAAIKLRDSNIFQSMSRAAGANVDNGVGVAGLLMNWGPVYVGALEYYCQDTLNIAYAEGKYGISLPSDIKAILALQYADQRSTGANLLNGGTFFATNQFGSRLELGYQTGILTLGYSVVNPSFQMQNPWSDNPVYTNAMIQSFQRAGEQAIVAGASYVFTPIGLPGIAASVFFYQGWTGAAAGPPTAENEWDFEIDWRPEFKPFSGFWLRARYGTSVVNQSNKLTTTDEVRVILNYSVKLY